MMLLTGKISFTFSVPVHRRSSFDCSAWGSTSVDSGTQSTTASGRIMRIFSFNLPLPRIAGLLHVMPPIRATS